MKYIKYVLLFLLLLSLNSCANEKATPFVQPVAQDLLIVPIANSLKDERRKNMNMTEAEQKYFVIASITKLNDEKKGEQILSKMRKEHADAIDILEQMNSCMSKANEKEQAQICLKDLEKSFAEIGRTYLSINSDKLVWTEERKKTIININQKMLKISKEVLECFNKNTTVESAFKCTIQSRKYVPYDSLINTIVQTANMYLLYEVGDEIFKESCKLSKVTIFEKPVPNQGVNFDKSYYPYGSYHDVDANGNYKSINHYTDNKSRINNKKLLSYVGFFERPEYVFDKKTKQTNKTYSYFDIENLSGVAKEKSKSRYKVVTKQIEDKQQKTYGINGFSINIIDNETNKTIASTIFYDNYHKKKLCAQTYDGNLDQEYFVYNVFSQ